MKTVHTNKGFTIAELLIVVAIIAVMVAIAIPVFTNQLEKAREGTDLSNIRAAYAEAALCVLNGKEGKQGNSSVTGGEIEAKKDASTGVWTITIAGVPIEQTDAGWVIDTSNVAGYSGLATDFTPTKGSKKITFTFGKDGKLTKISEATT